MAGDGRELGTSETPEAASGAVVHHSEPVMGTVVTITVVGGDLDRDGIRAAVDAACAVLHQADDVFSTWKADSPMSRVRRGELDLTRAPDVIGEVLHLCEQARSDTAGWFDPWAMPGGVDPTGLVKGWAVERARDVLVRAGVAGAMVNAGGDLAVWGTAPPEPVGAASDPPQGPSPWRVGIVHPWRADAVARVVELGDATGAGAAVATSGTYERGAHLVDPWSRRARCSLASATVIGPHLALADAFATALAVGGDRVLAAPWRTGGGYEAYLIRPDGSELATPGVATVVAPLPHSQRN
ncbi:MAG: FAD:protein FMN transferase [Acidimicrobiales bacterium]